MTALVFATCGDGAPREREMFKTLTVLGGLTALGVSGYSAMPMTFKEPGSLSVIRALALDLTGGWNEAACSDMPLACMRARARSLETAQGSIEEAATALRAQGERMADLVHEREVTLAQNDLLLREGRAIVQRMAANPQTPVSFVGQTYPNREALVRQLQLLFGEKNGMEKVLGQARAQQEAIRSRIDELALSRGQVRAALTMVPTQIELIKAGAVIADVAAAFRAIDETLQTSSKGVTGIDRLLRTTEELMQERPASGAPNDQIEQFLKEGASGG